MTEKKRGKKTEKKQNSFSEKSIDEILKISKNNITVIKNIFYELLSNKKSSKATELISRLIETTNKIYTIKNDTKLEVWIYKEGIYVPNGICEIREQLRKLLGSGYSRQLYLPIIDKIEADTMIEQKKFLNITNPKDHLHLLPVKNGILNLKTKKLEPYNPNIIFLNKLPVEYNPKALCPSIEKHFKDVLTTEDDSKLMFEIIGFCLWKDYFMEKAFLFSGFGRNGKSKTIELIKNLIGHDNCCSVPLAELTREANFSIAELFGKMVNLAGDLSSTALKETGLFKMSTGRDMLGANRKFLNKINFINYAKHIFACNELPKVYDTSAGFWEKWIVLDFPYTFKEKNDYKKIIEEELKTKNINHPTENDIKKIEQEKKIRLMNTEHIDKITTKEELEGLLIKAIEGLERLLNNKKFSSSQGSDEIKKYWTRRADSFLAFCQDNIEAGNIEDEILKANLRKYYFKYCKDNKLKGSSDYSLKITLEENYGVSEYRTHEQKTYWQGIKIKKDTQYYLDENPKEKISEKSKNLTK